jgi:hypothetical protein
MEGGKCKAPGQANKSGKWKVESARWELWKVLSSMEGINNKAEEVVTHLQLEGFRMTSSAITSRR